ncbi:glycoside hydrolase family 72 protein [Lentithecium fluviatile CBS 122367]|uniref:1,3-beta-glucanosyltransferase n=1 Tax=Lentithecium fluviatile CBS 122367 TaxID=1168545 RepID=A0A6G1IR96_9PLEO|nr:glycoside hydrolase family 72 protein [Lentithecium fluviatile CBS 122367]
MAVFMLQLWLLGVARLAFALSPAGANDRYLVNNETRGAIVMNGIWYILSNSTTDWAKMDPLTDAEACTRDAALMSRLGINNIYIDVFDSTANHDDCFSIFNSVGIYVTVLLAGGSLFVDEGAIDGAYTTERFEELFRRIDAIKDYENLLAIDVGILPDLYSIDVKRYAEVQNIFRVNHISCIILDEEAPSAAEFVSFYDFQYYEYQSPDLYVKNFQKLAAQLVNSTVPTWLSMYATAAQNGEPEFEVFNETLQETAMLYNVSNELLMPYGPLAGGSRFEWANVRSTSPVRINYGITLLDANGNIQLTPNFDTLSSIFSTHDTESWLSTGNTGTSNNISPIECKPELILNITSRMDDSVTLTLATDWELPTRPSGLDAIITSGMQGPRGQMVDVVVTTVKHEVRDSKGEVLKDVVLSPSKSEARTTTGGNAPGATASPPSTSSAGLSSGAKAGIGVGVGVGGGLALLGAGFLLLRRRKSKKASSMEGKDTNGNSDGSASVNKYEKAELATGPDVEAVPPAELPGQSTATPKEVPGDAYPGMRAPPAELPVHEPAVEMPGPRFPTSAAR